MDVQVLYFDGCNGYKLGDAEEGLVRDCVRFLLDQDTDSGQYDPTKGDEHQSLNDWTLEEAERALKQASQNRVPLVLDRLGDQQTLLIVRPS